jgi:hypothetical protein
MMTKTFLRCILAIGAPLGVLLVGVDSNVEPEDPSRLQGERDALSTAGDEPRDGTGCGICADGCNLGAGEYGHIAIENSDGSRVQYLGWHAECRPLDCDQAHPFRCVCYCANATFPDLCLSNCNPSPTGGAEQVLSAAPEISALFARVRSRGMAARARALEYQNVEWNSERRALQVIGCRGQVIAHVPVPPGESNF